MAVISDNQYKKKHYQFMTSNFTNLCIFPDFWYKFHKNLPCTIF